MKGLARVLYSYTPQSEDELKLEADELIEVIGEEEQGWWKGKLGGRTGVFPSNFVELTAETTSKANNNNIAGSHNKHHQPRSSNIGPVYYNKPVLSTPSNNNSINSKMDSQYNQDNSADNDDSSATSVERKPKPIRGVGFGNIFADGIKPKLAPIVADTASASDRFSNNNHAKLIPKKPPPPTPLDIKGDTSSSDTAPVLPPKPHAASKSIVREQAKVLYAYQAANADELTIKEGDLINIICKEIEDQGWWKGELNGKVGVFPDNFVELIPVPEANQNTETLPLRLSQKPSRPPPVVISGMSNMTEHSSSTPKATVNKDNSENVNDRSSLTQASFLSLNRSKFGTSPAKTDTISSNSNDSTTSIENITISDINNIPFRDANVSSKRRDNSGNYTASESFTIVESDNPSPIKLTHLTTQRARGPPSRRPPSTLALSHRDSVGRSNILDSNAYNKNDTKPEIDSPLNRVRESVKKHQVQPNLSQPSVVSLPAHSTTSRESIDPSFNAKVSADVMQQQACDTAPTTPSVPEPTLKKSPLTSAPINVTPAVTSTPGQPSWMVNLRKTTAEKKRESASGSEDANSSTNSVLNQPNAKQSPENISSNVNKPPFLRSVSGSAAIDGQTPSTPTSIAATNVKSLSSRYSGDFGALSSSIGNVINPTASNAPTQSAPLYSVELSGTGNNTDTNGNSIHSAAHSGQHASFDGQKSQSTHQSSHTTTTTTASTKIENKSYALPVIDGSSIQQLSQENDLMRKQQLSQQQQITANMNDINDLRGEVKRLKEAILKVPQQREIDSLVKQVNDLKETIDSQKKAHATLIKDLINDLAGERKKVATMQIEIDRIQKLTSTV